MARERGDESAVVAPQPRRVISGRGQNLRPVRTEHRSNDKTNMSGQCGDEGAIAAPQPSGVITGRGENLGAIGTELRPPDCISFSMSGQCGDEGAIAAPQSCRAIERCIVDPLSSTDDPTIIRVFRRAN